MTTLYYHPKTKDNIKQMLILSGFAITEETTDSFESGEYKFMFVEELTTSNI